MPEMATGEPVRMALAMMMTKSIICCFRLPCLTG